jgi:prophage regulatory protein
MMAQAIQVVAIKILRRPQVEDRTGLSRSTIYAKICANEFPKAVRLGRRAVGWVESEIDDWVMKQIQRSRPALVR